MSIFDILEITAGVLLAQTILIWGRKGFDRFGRFIFSK